MGPTLLERGFITKAAFWGVKENDLQLKGGDILLINGGIGSGKSTLMAHLAGAQMLPPIADDRVAYARGQAAELRAKGFSKLEIGADIQHLVYSTIPLQTSKDQGYLPRYSWQLDVERMRVPSDDGDDWKAQLFPVGSTMILDELMSIWDSRDHATKNGMPKGTRRFFQICRHHGISVIGTTLVANGTDTRLRWLANRFLLIVHRDDFDTNGKILPRDDDHTKRGKTVWYCLEFASDLDCAAFKNHEQVPHVARKFVHWGDIHECINSTGEEEEFFTGMQDKAYEFERGAV